MRLSKIKINNYRSIKETGDIAIQPLQAFVGENNAGKSNFLKAIQCFLSAGAGGMSPEDFNDQISRAFIECEFDTLNADEQKHLRPYLINDKIILRKELFIVEDEEKQKRSVKSEYHGYQAEPSPPHLSLKKIEDTHGSRPNWKKIAEENGLLDYVTEADGKITKASYKSGIEKFMQENEIAYDAPVLGETHALGIPTNLLSKLPAFYLLPGITDYSTEIDKRSGVTNLRPPRGRERATHLVRRRGCAPIGKGADTAGQPQPSGQGPPPAPLAAQKRRGVAEPKGIARFPKGRQCPERGEETWPPSRLRHAVSALFRADASAWPLFDKSLNSGPATGLPRRLALARRFVARNHPPGDFVRCANRFSPRHAVSALFRADAPTWPLFDKSLNSGPATGLPRRLALARRFVARNRPPGDFVRCANRFSPRHAVCATFPGGCLRAATFINQRLTQVP